MKECIEGIVISKENKTCQVLISRHSTCSGCGSCNGDSSSIMKAVDDSGANVGQKVLIEIEEINFLKGAFLIYVLPIILVIFGVICGYEAAFYSHIVQEAGAGIGGILLFIVAVFIIKRFDIDFSHKSESTRIVKVIG